MREDLKGLRADHQRKKIASSMRQARSMQQRSQQLYWANGFTSFPLSCPLV